MLRKLALAAFSALVALGTLEIALRFTRLGVHDLMHEWTRYADLLVLDESGGYLRQPAGVSVLLQGVTMRFNSLGMRDDEPRIPKPPETFRILCLGDSHTLGPGVTQDAIYPARLRAALAGPQLDLVAAAVAGWNTVAEARFLAGHIDRLAPNLVVLLYVTNDTEPTEAFDQARRANSWRTSLYRALVTHSQLLEWTAYVYKTRIAPPNAADMEQLMWLRQKGEQAFAPDEPGWLDSRAALLRIRDLTRARGARFVIFLNNQMDRPLERIARTRLREFSAETGVPVFDTFPFYAGYGPAKLMNEAFRDPHQNALGHALLADGIARTLRAEGFLPSLAATLR